MKNSIDTGDDMLEKTEVGTQNQDLSVGDVKLVRLTHSHLLTSIRQVNGRMTRELLNSPDTLRAVDLEDAPVPVDPRRFCELMAPYLCMN
jgi:hypothetical protein